MRHHHRQPCFGGACYSVRSTREAGGDALVLLRPSSAPRLFNKGGGDYRCCFTSPGPSYAWLAEQKRSVAAARAARHQQWIDMHQCSLGTYPQSKEEEGVEVCIDDNGSVAVAATVAPGIKRRKGGSATSIGHSLRSMHAVRKRLHHQHHYVSKGFEQMRSCGHGSEDYVVEGRGTLLLLLSSSETQQKGVDGRCVDDDAHSSLPTTTRTTTTITKSLSAGHFRHSLTETEEICALIAGVEAAANYVWNRCRILLNFYVQETLPASNSTLLERQHAFSVLKSTIIDELARTIRELKRRLGGSISRSSSNGNSSQQPFHPRDLWPRLSLLGLFQVRLALSDTVYFYFRRRQQQLSHIPRLPVTHTRHITPPPTTGSAITTTLCGPAAGRGGEWKGGNGMAFQPQKHNQSQHHSATLAADLLGMEISAAQRQRRVSVSVLCCNSVEYQQLLNKRSAEMSTVASLRVLECTGKSISHVQTQACQY